MRLFKATLFIVGALAPGMALADPATLTAAIAAMSTTQLVIAGVQVLSLVSTVYGAYDARRKARNAAAKAKADYNAGLQDRTVTVLQADPPWRVVYGEAVVGGYIVDIFSTDKTGVKENGSTYTKADGLKHMVIVLAAHQCQEVSEILLDGVPIGTLDGAGWASGVTASANGLSTSTTDTRRVTFTNSVTLSTETPISILAAFSGLSYTGNGDASDGGTYTDQLANCSISGNTINGPAGVQVTVDYTVTSVRSSLRVSIHLGSDTQTVDTYLNSVAPTRYTAAHRLRGLCYASVTLDLEDQRFQGGPPGLTFRTKGKMVLDTRTSTTAYSDNPALIARDFLTAPWGGEVLASEVNNTFTNAAANVCDTRASATVQSHADTFTVDTATDTITFATPRWLSTGDGIRITTTGVTPAPLSVLTTYYVIPVSGNKVYKLATSVANAYIGTAINLTSTGTGTHTGTYYDYALYTCNGSFTTDDNPEGVLDEILNSMAGQAVYGGEWQTQAGAWTSPVLSLGDDDLSGQAQVMQADASLEELFNGMRGQYIPVGTATAVDYDPYYNSTFVTADGKNLWTSKNLPFTNAKHRARNLARVFIEKSRSAQILVFPAKIKAWPVQVGDRVNVTSSLYGITNKTYRVLDWQFGIESAVVLTLVEDDSTIWDLADAAVPDPTPNTDLQNPWVVGQVTGVAVASGNENYVTLADGTVIPRVRVSWNTITDALVIDGGRVEVLWRYAAVTLWTKTDVVANDGAVYITEPREGRTIIVEVRAVNKYGVVGPSSFVTHQVTGKTSAPQNVSSLAYANTPSGVRITWTPCTDRDYSYTELRFGASYAAGTFLWRGTSSDFTVVPPSNGTYTVWAVHYNNSGVQSVSPASISVVYTAITTASVLTLSSTGVVFVFDDPLSTSSTSPTITFTAKLVNLSGTVTFAATAYNSAGVSQGSVTLSNVTATTADLSVTNFLLGLGTAVRFVKITATLSTFSDSVTVYRADDGGDAITLFMSNEAHTVPTAFDGSSPDFTGATNAVRVFQGYVDVTNLWTLTSTVSNCGGTFNGVAMPNAVSSASTPNIVINSLSADTGTVTITATRSGYPTQTAVMSLSRSKAGTPGTAGANGTRTATLVMYQWASSRPTVFPSGTSTYTWSTGAFTLPATPDKWTLGQGVGSAGLTLWACQMVLTDSGTSATSVVTWTTSTAFSQGAVGDDGSALVQAGLHVRRVYFQQSTKPATPTGGTYNFENGVFNAPSGALTAPPSTTSTPIWECEYTFASSTPYATLTAQVWNEPTTFAWNQGASSTLVSTYVLRLYALTTTEPFAPTSSTAKYNISTGVFTAGDLSTTVSWSPTRPTPTATQSVWCTEIRVGTMTPAVDVTLGLATTTGLWSIPYLVDRKGLDVRTAITAHGGTYGINQAWSDGLANRVIRNAVMGETVTTTLGSTALNRVNDTVTLTDTSVSPITTTTKTWNGSVWAANTTRVSGDLIAGGTISSGVSLNTSGYVKADGFTSLSVIDPLSGSSTTQNVAGSFNTSGSARTGLYSKSDDAFGFGGLFYNSTSSGYALAARGGGGMLSIANAVGKPALEATGAVFPSSATASHGITSSAWGANSAALYAVGNFDVFSGNQAWAIRAEGPMSITDRIVSTLTGQPSLVLSINSSTPALAAGGFALHNTKGPIFSNGSAWFYIDAPLGVL